MSIRRFIYSIVFMSTLLSAQTNAINGKVVVVYSFPKTTAPTVTVWGSVRATLGTNANGTFSGTISGIGPWESAAITFADGTNLALSTALYGSSDTLYIYPGATGNVNGIVPPKIVYAYNPWLASAPALKFSGQSLPMRELPDKCNWFEAFLPPSPSYQVGLVDVNFGELYGNSGLDDASAIDLSRILNLQPQVYILPTPQPDGPPTITQDYPNIAGQCGFNLAMIVRDMSKTRSDFQFDNAPGQAASFGCIQTDPPQATTGEVADTLDANQKPVFSGTSKCKNELVNQWFQTVTLSPGVTNDTCIDLPMHRSDDGMWLFNSIYDTTAPGQSQLHAFSPIDNFNVYNETNEMQLINQIGAADIDAPPGLQYWLPGNTSYLYTAPGVHNYLFCDEAVATFNYQAGQKFTFAGDDDFWLFIDNQLALDIGGLHARVAKILDLQNDVAIPRGWADGSSHTLHTFHCDRNGTGSTFEMKTSIYMKQTKGLDCIQTQTSTGLSLTCQTTQGGTGDCRSMFSDTSVQKVSSSLIYYLIDPNGDTIKQSTASETFPEVWYGGINLQSANTFSLNQSAMTNLPGGRYTFRFCDQKNLVQLCDIRQFVIQGNGAIINANADTTLAGRSMKIIVGNLVDGAVDPSVIKYSLSLSGDMQACQDSMCNLPARFQTGADGLDTLWIRAPRTMANDIINWNLKVTGGQAQSKSVSFLLPHLRFLDSTGKIIPDPKPSLGKWVFMQYPFTIEAYTDKFGICKECMGDTLSLFSKWMHFKPTPTSADLTRMTLDSNGHASMYAYADTVVSYDKMEFELNTSLPTPRPARPSYAIWDSIQLQMPPVPQIARNEIFDVNGDGIADRLEVQFDRNIADSLPTSLSYTWPDNGSTINVSSDSLKTALQSDGQTFVFLRKFTDTIQTSGSGIVKYAYPFQGTTFVIPRQINDKMGPVIKLAQISLTSASDILALKMSEKILSDSARFNLTLPWIQFKKAGKVVNLDHKFMSWSDSSRTLRVTFPADADPSVKAVVGDSVQIVSGTDSGLLRDLYSNYANPNNRWAPIFGQSRIQIQKIVFDSVNLDQAIFKKGYDFSVIPIQSGSPADSVQRLTGRPGFIIPFDVFNNSIRDKNGNPVPADSLVLNYELMIYTNLGGFVNSRKSNVKCSDAIFNGNCELDGNDRDVFIGWNYFSSDGRKVGTGAYIAHLNWSVSVRGQVPDGASGEVYSTWGVLRTSTQSPFKY